MMKSLIVAIGVMCTIGGGVWPVVAEEPGPSPVYRHVDRVTGAQIRLFRPSADRVEVQVVSRGLTIMKSLGPGRSETRIVTPVEDLSIVVNQQGLSVSDRRAGATHDGRTRRGLEQARNRLQASAAVRRASVLLGELEPVKGSPITHTLLVTQALLAAALGSPDADGELKAWSKGAATGGRLVRVGGQAQPDGPTDCWTLYVGEAISSWIEYEDCVDSEEWWDVPGMLGCLLIYDVRAIGAFSWWVSCVGFRG